MAPSPTNMPRHARPSPGKPRRPSGPWKNGPIPVLGLVGPIGAGKSLVAAELLARGAIVLDADAIGHALLDQRPARELVLDRFGLGVLAEKSEEFGPDRIDRKALGAIVFADRKALRDLEAILHPRMRRTVEKAIARAQRRREVPFVVIDAAILYEAGWSDLCDRVLFVDAGRDRRLERVAAQRGWTEADLDRREATQLPPDEKKGRADAVLDNEGPPDDLPTRVAQTLQGLLRKTPNEGRRGRPTP